jgi:hypothetical protein
LADFPIILSYATPTKELVVVRIRSSGVGALAIDVDRCDSFFPDIYNDDWFFMLDANGRLRSVARAGEVRQEHFDPFRSVRRAQTEEFGDVLAEGIYWLLDQGGSAFDADHRHWAEFLNKRERFIGRILEMVGRHDLPEDERWRMIDALHGSLGRLKSIKPELCERYLKTWANDRKMWLRHVEALPNEQARQRAIGYLSRPGAPRLSAYLRCQDGLGLESAV